MSINLLSTKFYIPLARAGIVPRPRLTEKLLSGVSRPQGFTLLTGPAGSGKTTLLSQCAAQFRWPVAWLSLDDEDNDPIRFWTYLIAAFQSVLDEVGEAALALLHTSQPLLDDTIPTILINSLIRQNRALVLILDDYHAIQNPSIHAGLGFLLDYLPDNLHIIISTRANPPWPLARYRARNQLSEIRAQELHFTLEETAQFLNTTMKLTLSTEAVVALEARTEGWVAGLQLAALSMQGRSDIPSFVQAFTGSHVYVAEYLVEEVLQRQPEDVHAFLLHTSILKRMNAGLCTALTGRQDGQKILAALQRANIFVVPLDDEGQWFRYHHLFADLLQARLSQALPADAIVALHTRAADWYEHNGFELEAIHHALAAQDFARVAALVEQAAHALMSAGQLNILKGWLEALPPASFHLYPRLAIYRIWIDIVQGKLDLSQRTLQELETRTRALPSLPENHQLRVEAVVFLCHLAAFLDTSCAIRLAQEILAELPEGNPQLRAHLFTAFYIANALDGNVEQSELAYWECLRLAQTAGSYSLVSNTTMIRSVELYQYGRLQEAARYCHSLIEAGTELGQAIFYPVGPAYIGLAGIYLEWNDLATAEAHLQQGMELCRQGGLDGVYTGHTFLARLRQARGDFEGALEELHLLEQKFQRREYNALVREILIRLAMGDIPGASGWLMPLMTLLNDDPDAPPLPLAKAEAFEAVLIRILLAQGEIERANQLLDELQATATQGRRFGRLIEVYLLRGLAWQQQQAGAFSAEATRCLARALELAEPEGYTLLFLEEGPALIPLLHAVVKQAGMPTRLKAHACKLLDALGDYAKTAVPRPPDPAAGLVEPLSRREMEVLRLITAGDSNRTIAGKLIITLRTVKKHTGNIFAKLGVSSRTQAIARARTTGLLPPDG